MSSTKSERSGLVGGGMAGGAPGVAAALTPALAPIQVAELDGFLRAVIAHQRLAMEANRAHRAALSAADLLAISKAVVRQEQVARGLIELDQRRDRMLLALGMLAKPRGGVAAATVRLRELVERAPERYRPGLHALLEEANTLTKSNTGALAALRGASRSLAAHMDGLMAHITRAMSETTVYAARAAGGASAGQVSGFSVNISC